MKILIRKGKPSDIPQLAGLVEEFRKTQDLCYYTKKAKNYLALRTAPFRAMMRSKNAIFLVAEDRGNITGYASASEMGHPEFYADRKYAFLKDIFLSKKYRGKKISDMLMQQIFSWARKRGLKTIDLTCWSNNSHALGFYKRQGFTEVRKTMRKKL